MRQTVYNLGPIAEADIEIKPLTVIIGKNCVGKSYYSNFFYSILTCLRSGDNTWSFFAPPDAPEELTKLSGN
jgi:predicted ATPase